MNSTVLIDPQGTGFDAPFEMLAACHDRVRRTLALLERLQAHLATHGADDQARQAAQDVMRYFDLAAPAHHDDEERHVFPAVLRADPVRWSPLVERLRADHREMSKTWSEARAALEQVAQAVWDAPTRARASAWPRFAALYAEHLKAEDQLVFPAAAHTLDDGARAAMGAEMAQRRGVVPATPLGTWAALR